MTPCPVNCTFPYHSVIPPTHCPHCGRCLGCGAPAPAPAPQPWPRPMPYPVIPYQPPTITIYPTITYTSNTTGAIL